MANETITREITKTIDFLNQIFSSVLTKFIVAILILFIGFVIGRIIGKLTQKVLHEIELNRIIKKASGVRIAAEEFVGIFLAYFIYFITIVMALNQLGLTTTILNIIAGGIILIVIVSIILGTKDFVPNVIAGLTIYQKHFIKDGDYIKVKGAEGKIIHTDLIETRIETKKGDIISIPNSTLIKNEVIKLKKKKVK